MEHKTDKEIIEDKIDFLENRLNVLNDERILKQLERRINKLKKWRKNNGNKILQM